MTVKESQQGTNDPPASKSPPLGRLILSVLAAAIGVQTDKNRQQDFQSTSILPYIIAGVVFTVLFVLGLVVIVNIVAG